MKQKTKRPDTITVRIIPSQWQLDGEAHLIVPFWLMAQINEKKFEVKLVKKSK